ncbi:MAG: MBL fold metallo-hydrolase [Candidatus Competibacteraceae bacterium]|jgi:7,8-dihydropterin-6-yl-methyl-4-(beta-D-ribofuranosyl)aminobenzene 5'-phosphate synthase|nr:MBL fold metallo-hydrolase [Candidatus Competibacteraceae bacterium]
MSTNHPTLEIGTLKRLKILCISETGWFDNATLFGDVKSAGGMGVSQYNLTWPPLGDLHPDNAAGSSALIEAEALDGTIHQLLFDTGWNPAWMDRRFAEEGIDKRLQQGEIEALIISHEHFDHFWGISSTLKHCPDLPIFIPEGFHEEGLALIKQAGHTGPLTTVHPDQPLVLFPGFALTHFRMNTLLQVQGENVLYFNIADKGLTMVTGCGHGGVLNLLDYARETFAEPIHALYGGLHISPFEEWDAEHEQVIDKLSEYHIAQLGCNHCTGVKAVQRMTELGMPVVRGSARHGSKTELFLGNGDVLEV